MHEEALFEGQNVKIKIKLVDRYNLLNYEEKKNMKMIYKSLCNNQKANILSNT